MQPRFSHILGTILALSLAVGFPANSSERPTANGAPGE